MARRGALGWPPDSVREGSGGRGPWEKCWEHSAEPTTQRRPTEADPALPPEVEPAERGRQQRGLRDVVRRRLGQELDKRMQTSDWDARPLTQEQLDYAALDAVCLLWVFSAMSAA